MMDVPDEASLKQVAIMRRLTPEQRWDVAQQLYWTARRHKAAFLHSLHPDWSWQQVQTETRRLFLHAGA